MVHVFHFLPTSLVFETVNPFPWIFYAISSEKSCLISIWRQDTRIFPACWILIGQFKFPARQPYARIERVVFCLNSTRYGVNHLLRWLTGVFLRLDSARYHHLPDVSINHAFTNDASNPKKKGNHFGAWKTLNHFGISSNSFKLHLNKCLSLGSKKGWQKNSINNR